MENKSQALQKPKIQFTQVFKNSVSALHAGEKNGMFNKRIECGDGDKNSPNPYKRLSCLPTVSLSSKNDEKKSRDMSRWQTMGQSNPKNDRFNKKSCQIINNPSRQVSEKEPLPENQKINGIQDQVEKEERFNSISSLLKEIISEQHCLDEKSVDKILTDIKGVIKSNIPGTSVKLYGSYFTGFAIANSDLNLEFFTNAENVSNKLYRQMVKYLVKELCDYYVDFQESMKIGMSCIDIIEPKYGTRCHLRFLGKESNYYRTSKLLRNIAEIDTRIKTLVICLRHWAEVCEIHEAERGRLPSLAYVLMVLFYLQQVKPPLVPIVNVREKLPILPEQNTQSLGELWMGLMEFYSTVFNWRDEVISIVQKPPILKSNFKWGKCWVAIEAPFDSSVNIAEPVIRQDICNFIQSCFKQSFKYFQELLQKPRYNENTDAESGYESIADTSGCESKGVVPEFSALNFTKGLIMPTFCPDCDELGFTCEDCLDDEMPEFDVLPPPSKEFLININTALHEAYEIHSLKEEEKCRRIDLIKTIEQYVKKKIWDADLCVVGSTITGFGFKNSDLDICLTFRNQKSCDLRPEKVRKVMRNLCFHLRRSPMFSSVIAIYSAKIPIIQFVHSETKLRGDISLYNSLAKYNSKLLRYYSRIDERVRILGCAMKLLAKNACIADTAQKSLSSYSYILMVIHYLQRTKPPILPFLQDLYEGEKQPEEIVEDCNVWFCDNIKELEKRWKPEQNNSTPAELWLGLLQYYTVDFDFSHTITLRREPVNRLQRRFARLFNIEDPFIVTKNLGSVISDEMSATTWRTLLRARKLFNFPMDAVPSGFESFEDYFFHPMSLTDGRIMKSVECELCGKQGHSESKCVRYNWNGPRGRGVGRSRMNK